MFRALCGVIPRTPRGVSLLLASTPPVFLVVFIGYLRYGTPRAALSGANLVLYRRISVTVNLRGQARGKRTATVPVRTRFIASRSITSLIFIARRRCVSCYTLLSLRSGHSFSHRSPALETPVAGESSCNTSLRNGRKKFEAVYGRRLNVCACFSA